MRRSRVAASVTALTVAALVMLVPTNTPAATAGTAHRPAAAGAAGQPRPTPQPAATGVPAASPSGTGPASPSPSGPGGPTPS
ncbi:MAG TPA: hypothetical protein VNV66_03610, partial [Pilimelia sp.]|nr:hypothetical protein [Pilimelia sp.]